MNPRSWPPIAGLLALLLVTLAMTPRCLAARQAKPVLVHPRPHDAMVAVAVRFPTGSALDPEDREGTAFLLGRILEVEGQRRLQPLSATVETTVARNEFTVTLRAPKEEWDRAWAVVRELLASTPLSDGVLDLVRESQRERLVFESGAPVRAFEVERDRFFLGSSPPGGQRPRETPIGLASLSPGDLNDFRARHLRLEESVVAVVGPLTPSQVQGVLRAPTRVVDQVVDQEGEGEARAATDTLATGDAPPTPARQPRMHPLPAPLQAPAIPAASAAWSTGDRIVVDQELTSTWIAVAWPLPAGTPALLLDFLAHIVGEELNPSPPDPGLYRAEVRVERIGNSPILVVNATVDPRVALRWEERILQSMESVAQDPPRGAFFELTRRRYRASRLLEQAHPEARALWLTRAHVAEGEVGFLTQQMWALTREGLQGLVQARGEPRTLLYGPARMMEPM